MYLTFDDGPHPLFTPIVLRLLAEHGARATFFPSGQTLRLFWGDEEMQDLLDRGHAIGSHSWVHHRLPDLSQVDLERDLTRASAAIEARAGFRPTCVRAPYGITDPRVERTFAEMHLEVVGWDADPVEPVDRGGAGARSEVGGGRHGRPAPRPQVADARDPAGAPRALCRRGLGLRTPA
jgi:peptidoglycan/xylan/chitin deacetylase (PgdA/CDA1 family)